MTKHALVAGAPIAIDQVIGSEFKTVDQKHEFLDFLELCLGRATDRCGNEDCDLFLPLADLFGRIERERKALNALSV